MSNFAVVKNLKNRVEMNIYRNIVATTKMAVGTYLVLLLLCVGCNRGDELQNNDSSDLRTEAEEALMVCEELYLNYDAPAYEDAHVEAMRNYYMDSDEHKERARALFFCAQHSYACGDMAEALLYLIAARRC